MGHTGGEFAAELAVGWDPCGPQGALMGPCGRAVALVDSVLKFVWSTGGLGGVQISKFQSSSFPIS